MEKDALEQKQKKGWNPTGVFVSSMHSMAKKQQGSEIMAMDKDGSECESGFG